jgi:hypothetical protein
MAAADPTSAAFAALMKVWGYADRDGRGVTAEELLRAVRADEYDDGEVATQAALRAAVMELCPAPRGADLPSPKSVGRRLTSFRGRVAGQFKLTGAPNRLGTMVWRVVQVER